MRRLPRWRHHALVVLWAVAAAHATRFMVQAVVGGRLLQGISSPMAFFRSSGLETLATCALVLRVRPTDFPTVSQCTESEALPLPHGRYLALLASCCMCQTMLKQLHTLTD